MDSMNTCRERFEALEQRTNAMALHPHTMERQRRWWRGMSCGVLMLLGALGITLGSGTTAHADAVACGDILGPGGRFVLEHNLDCDVSAVTVRDGAILDLNGHIVACRPGIGFQCIVLTGTGAQLLNGAVQGGLHESIVLEGPGGHIVRNVTSTVVDTNFIVVQSDHNQLINVMAESRTNPAFNIAGNHNRLINNIARCFELVGSAGGCINVRGNENRLIENFATGTAVAPGVGGGPGFMITGDNNVLRGNRAIGNARQGIVVTGTGNRLTRNTALENALDLEDTNGDCTQNTWRDNTFRTSTPACIDSAGENIAQPR